MFDLSKSDLVYCTDTNSEEEGFYQLRAFISINGLAVPTCNRYQSVYILSVDALIGRETERSAARDKAMMFFQVRPDRPLDVSVSHRDHSSSRLD